MAHQRRRRLRLVSRKTQPHFGEAHARRWRTSSEVRNSAADWTTGQKSRRKGSSASRQLQTTSFPRPTSRRRLRARESVPFKAARSPGAGARPSASVLKMRFRPVEWDDKGDNRAAVIFLNVVDGGRFKEVGEISKDDAAN
jgi:hypothetical protein